MLGYIIGRYVYIYTIGISGTYGWDMGYLEWISIMAMIRYGYGNNMYIYRYIYINTCVYIYMCVNNHEISTMLLTYAKIINCWWDQWENHMVNDN